MRHVWITPFTLALGCAFPAWPQTPPPAAPIPFVDAHAHLNDEAMQLEFMNRYGASHAVVFWGGHSSNDSVAQAAGRHPQRLIAFASISPERGIYRPAWDGDDKALLETLDRLLATGQYKGIGEISAVHFPSAGFGEADFNPLGPMMTGIMSLARKYRVPVMVMVHIESADLTAPSPVTRIHHPA